MEESRKLGEHNWGAWPPLGVLGGILEFCHSDKAPSRERIGLPLPPGVSFSVPNEDRIRLEEDSGLLPGIFALICFLSRLPHRAQLMLVPRSPSHTAPNPPSYSLKA